MPSCARCCWSKLSLMLLHGALGAAQIATVAQAASPPPTAAEVLAASSAAQWRTLDPQRLLVLEWPGARVVIELAPGFAPRHVANIKRLARAGYFEHTAIVRVQDNYVVQWGDPLADDRTRMRSLGEAAARLAPEFERKRAPKQALVKLPDPDVYAAGAASGAGFLDGFPVAFDAQRVWLAHCYGMVGVGRDEAADSGNGAELYAVIGHAPRHLDHNVTLVGRVVEGIEHFSSLPRGPAPMGFYAPPQRPIALTRVTLGADLPPTQRPALEALDTDGASFKALIDARRERREPWFLTPTGRIDLCNVPLPVRPVAPKPATES